MAYISELGDEDFVFDVEQKDAFIGDESKEFLEWLD